MLLSRFNLIYLHPPKTAGNSLQSVLLPYSDDHVVLRADQDGKDRFELRGLVTPTKHARLADYRKRMKPEKFAACRVAISVRDPLDRAISAYFSPSRWMRKRWWGSWYKAKPTYERAAFIDLISTIPSMTDFLRLSGGIRTPDIVVRFETYQSDATALMRALGITDPVPHLNRTRATPAQRSVILDDAELRTLVCQRFAEDYRTFGYLI